MEKNIINKMMEKNRVKREPYNKIFVIVKKLADKKHYFVSYQKTQFLI